MRREKESGKNWSETGILKSVAKSFPGLTEDIVRFCREKVAKLVALNDSVILSRSGRFLPALVFATSILTTATLWQSERKTAGRDLSQAVQTHAVDVERSVDERLKGYAHILAGVRGLFIASEKVTRDEFRAYVESLRLKDRHPEIQGVSLSYHIAASDRESHTRMVRKEGFPRYWETWQPGASEYAPIEMIAPFSQKNAAIIGFDNFSSPDRKETMELARDTDSVTISSKVRLAQDNGGPSAPGIIMYLPMYQKGSPHLTLEDRRKNHLGWIAVSFRVRDFMAEITRRHVGEFDVELYDGAVSQATGMLFDSTARWADQSVSDFGSELKFGVFNREWTLSVRPLPNFEEKMDRGRPEFVLVFGTGVTFALTIFLGLLIRGRGNTLSHLRALRKSNEDLRESEARYRVFFGGIGTPLLVTDGLDGTIIVANPEAAVYYGYSEEELVGMPMAKLNRLSLEEIDERAALVTGQHIDRFNTVHYDVAWAPRIVEISASHIEINGRQGCMQVIHDVTDRCRANEKIQEITTHDELTGLPNRRLLVDRLSQALTHASRNGSSVALMFIDLDHFKVVNDSIGHDVGDLLLQQVAERMKSVVRSEDTVARQGGDEFLVLLGDLASPSHASVAAEKLLAVLQAPFHIQGHELHIGASIGIATYPNDAHTAEDLMKFADIAMYMVKGTGRQSYRFFSPEMHEASVEHQILRDALHHALEKKQMSLVFQPIVHADSEKVSGMEALIRWNHAEFGPISPTKFIPIAESNGVIVEIGEWVIRQVCGQISEWKTKGVEVPRVTINLSVRQFRLKTLVEDISRIFEETGVDPRHIGLEITESMLIEDVEAVAATLESLVALGLEISIDDFWTGYSNLRYLNRFPIRTLKIDRSFVADLQEGADDVRIIQGTISLAHSLGIKVVAEGVETAHQLRVLRSMDCDFIQGYFFGRPSSAIEIEQRLDRPC